LTEIQRTAVVTGVSTGIGRAIVNSMIDEGWRVFGSVRKQSDADSAQQALGKKFSPLIFDVTETNAVMRAAELVDKALDGRTLNGLVNNAGIAVAGPVAKIPLDEIKHQFDVNVYGPIRVIQAFLPLLGADHSRTGEPGKIINMSSVAGKIASPFMSPYAMSKHALEALSDSLRRELMIHGIDVAIVGPGAIKTPIWDKADKINVEQYRDTEYADLLSGMKDMMQEFGNEGLPPEDVGKLVAGMLSGRKNAARYAIQKDRFLKFTLPRLLPTRMIDKAIAKRFGMTPRT
jgi:NAD(P)-dependent dehydrogenase (short-subunit alcohol dehydrogenase family)